MAFSFIGTSNGTGSGVTDLQYNVPVGTAAGDLLVAAYAFEGVAAGSGPWIIPNTGQLQPDGIGPAGAWFQYGWQTPGASGVGIEVWCAIESTASNPKAFFTTSQNVVSAMCTYRGEYNPTGQITGAPPRLFPTQQWTGHQPASPAVTPNVGELVVAVGGDTMTASNFGTPSGFTSRADVRRAGAGTVGVTMADQTATVAGSTGPITFPNNASSATAAGSTETLVFVLAPTTTGAGGIMDAPMPEDLQIGEGYTVRVTALDPTTATPVSGVKLNTVILTGTSSGTADTGGLATGDWFLVPGPGA